VEGFVFVVNCVKSVKSLESLNLAGLFICLFLHFHFFLQSHISVLFNSDSTGMNYSTEECRATACSSSGGKKKLLNCRQMHHKFIRSSA
jgi:hypothetical protein